MTKINKEDCKIMFMGTPEFAVPVLESLLNNKLNIVSVVTQKDKKVGRKQDITPPPIKNIANKNNLKIFQPENLKNNSWNNYLNKINPDIIIVCAFGFILPAETLNYPQYGCVNVHASLLPKYRGSSPIQEAIKNGELKTGITIMKMDAGVDTGDIISQAEIEITTTDDFISLSKKLSETGAKELVNVLPNYIEGKIELQKQDEKEATLTKKLEKADGLIDWTKSADKIYQQIKAYQIFPKSFTYFENKKLEIIEVKASNISNLEAGQIKVQNSQIVIGCNNGQLVAYKLKLEGKKEMNSTEFINGFLKNKILNLTNG
ncbi:MAG: methionyl-tRNA formyltransferase [bacterium]